MFSERLGANETRCQQDFHGLSVSKRLVRSVSQKLRKKNNRSSEEEDDDDVNGVSLKCLTLYGRGRGCKVGAYISDEFGDSSNRRRSSSGEEGKGYKPVCGPQDSVVVDCFSYGVRDRFWRRHHRKRRNPGPRTRNTKSKSKMNSKSETKTDDDEENDLDSKIWDFRVQRFGAFENC